MWHIISIITRFVRVWDERASPVHNTENSYDDHTEKDGSVCIWHCHIHINHSQCLKILAARTDSYSYAFCIHILLLSLNSYFSVCFFGFFSTSIEKRLFFSSFSFILHRFLKCQTVLNFRYMNLTSKIYSGIIGLCKDVEKFCFTLSLHHIYRQFLKKLSKNGTKIWYF